MFRLQFSAGMGATWMFTPKPTTLAARHGGT